VRKRIAATQQTTRETQDSSRISIQQVTGAWHKQPLPSPYSSMSLRAMVREMSDSSSCGRSEAKPGPCASAASYRTIKQPCTQKSAAQISSSGASVVDNKGNKACKACRHHVCAGGSKSKTGTSHVGACTCRSLVHPLWSLWTVFFSPTE